MSWKEIFWVHPEDIPCPLTPEIYFAIENLRLYQPVYYRMLGCICLVPSGVVIGKVTRFSLMSGNFLWIEDKIMSLLNQRTKIKLLFVELAFYLNFSTCLYLGYAPKHTENRWENHSTCLYLKFPIYTSRWIIYTSDILIVFNVKAFDRFELRYNQ